MRLPTLAAEGATSRTLPFDATSSRASSRDGELSALFVGLEAAPRAHDFFAVLRRIEALHPELPRLGQALRPSQEAVRLGQEAELDFAPAALEHFSRRSDGVPRLGVRFFGLLGPQGPMPLHLTEHVRERLRSRGDPTIARFLDVFHHRLLALFYRAWAQVQPTVQQDRPQADRFGAWLGSTIGLGGTAAPTGALPVEAQLFQAGLLGARSRHPEGLRKLLSQYFQVPVDVEQHIAHWLVIEAEDRTRLGVAASRAGKRPPAPARLGINSTSGGKVRDRQYKFRVALGPLTLAQYEGFLPGTTAWRALHDWVRHYAGLDLQWDVQLALAAAEVPEPRLGRVVRLGVTAWIGQRARDRERDRSDLRLRPVTSFLLRREGARHA